MTQNDYNAVGTTAGTAVDTATIEMRTGERIRWGAIIAGLFAALSALVVLIVLGAALGLAAFDAGAIQRGDWNIAAGIWGAISMIVAFILGGWLAARWAGPFARDNSALLHGAMVWAVAIPLSLFLFSNMGAMLGMTTAVAYDQQRTGQFDRFDDARPAGAQLGERLAAETTDDPAVAARRAAHGAAWGTLITLLLGLGAAALGGYLGAAGTRDSNWYRRGVRSGDTTGTGTTTP